MALTRGQFAHLSTTDLMHWQQHPLALPITDPTECSLGTGCGGYVLSKQPIEDTRDWIRPASQALRDALGAPVVCEFKGGRYLYAGFPGGASYAQELVFRELVQEPDGSLSMKWPAEMIPPTGNKLALPCEPVKGRVAMAAHGVRVDGKDGFACGTLTRLPQNVRIKLRAKPEPGVGSFGLCCRGSGAYAQGCELRFDPARQRLEYGQPLDGESAVVPGRGAALDHVPDLDKQVTVDLIVKDGLVDVCVGNRRTLISRNSQTGDRRQRAGIHLAATPVAAVQWACIHLMSTLPGAWSHSPLCQT
ncbi:MAG: hypothetical protein ABSH34_01120 [Verrucomicrobiota bacterium]|jgi:hypothetical protein